MVLHRPSDLKGLEELLTATDMLVPIGGGTCYPVGAELRGREMVTLLDLPEARVCAPGHLGAAVTLWDVANQHDLPPALRAAAAAVGTPAVRAGATVGGNISPSPSRGCVAVPLLAADPELCCASRDAGIFTCRFSEYLDLVDTIVISINTRSGVWETVEFRKTVRRQGPGPGNYALCRVGSPQKAMVVSGGYGMPLTRLEAPSGRPNEAFKWEHYTPYARMLEELDEASMSEEGY